MKPEEAVRELTEEGCLIETDVAGDLRMEHVQRIKSLSPKPMVVNRELIDNLNSSRRAGASASLEIVTDVDPGKQKRDVNDFVDYYNDRYERIRDIILRRRDIQSAVSISRLSEMEERRDVSAIGIVKDKYRTGNGKFIVYMEDPSGETKVLADQDSGEKIIEDEVIGVNGSLGDDIIFADSIIWPDVPLPSEVKSLDEDVYAAFISDIHFGSIDTLEEKTDAFVKWINSDEEIAEKTRYLFVVGDMVEGVGVYPGQERDLKVSNLGDQYDMFSDFIKKIGDDVEIIIIPGNHDMVRLAEPQPPLPEDVVPELYEMDNVHMAPNPCYVNVHGHESEGITVLLYHGYSFDGHVTNIQHLRQDSYENPEHAMIDYLKRRHLAPLYGSNLLIPQERDRMVIDEVPDIFAMGHTHSFACTTYKGINIICAGTFQGQTDFQKRMGHVPEPGKVAMINLRTRKAHVKVF